MMVLNRGLAWTKIQQMYEKVHTNIVLVLLFILTEVQCSKGLLLPNFIYITFDYLLMLQETNFAYMYNHWLL